MIEKLIEMLASAPHEDLILDRIKHTVDEGADFWGKGTYEYYFAIGQMLRPERIVEIGTRFGYSLASLIKGSGAEKMQVWIFDNERDHHGSNDYVVRWAKRFPGVELFAQRVDTRKLRNLNLPFQVDLAHVDAEHSVEGCFSDCLLCRDYIRPGGHILVDDTKNPVVREGADNFISLLHLKATYIDSYQGMYLIEV